MKSLMITLGAAAIAVGASHAQSALLDEVTTAGKTGYQYDGNAMPASSSPAWNSYFGGDASVSGGILTVTTPGSGTSDVDFWETRIMGGVGQAWNPTGLGTTVEIRVKTDYNVDPHSWAGRILIGGASRDWSMLIGTNYITDNAGGGDFSITTDDAFHTYRFVISNEASGPMSMYVDGNTTPTNTWTGGGSGSLRLAFGDLGNAEQGQMQWDYIQWTNEGAFAPVPEPAALSLLGLGALALRRGRRQ